MTALIIIACVLIPLTYLLTRKIKLTAQYKDTPSVYASLLFYKYPIYPPKEKGKNKKAKKKAKTVPQKGDEVEEQGEADIKTILELVANIFKAIYEKTLGYLHIKLARIHIIVGTDDAAHTALLYGLIAQSAAYLIDILDRITNVYPKDISVNADFASVKTTADISVEASVRVWQAFHIAILAAMEYLRVTERQKGKSDKNTVADNKIGKD